MYGEGKYAKERERGHSRDREAFIYTGMMLFLPGREDGA